MNLTKCNRGHFYDSDKYTECPHCNSNQNEGIRIIPDRERPTFFDLTIIKKGFYENKELFFHANQVGVGKEPNVCHILLESIYGSRLHAKFVHQDGNWGIIDTNSTNGTKINGEQIEPNKFYKLKDQDEIAFSTVDIYIFIDNKEKEETFYCYKCGRKIIKQNEKLPLICGYCNEKQELVDKETTTLICKNCYNCNYVTDNFCRKCGKPLKEAVIKSLDYYICIYIPTIDTIFNKKINGIHVLKNCQMTNASVRIDAFGEGIVFSLDSDNKDKITITTIYTSGQYQLFQGFHKESSNYTFKLDKPNTYEYDFGFGSPNKNKICYIISKNPISPETLLGEYIKKRNGYYISKAEFTDSLKDTADNLKKFIKQVNSSKDEFNYEEFDELLFGKTVPLRPVDLQNNEETVILKTEDITE